MSTPPTSLALRADDRVEPWRASDWQRLWLSLRALPWKSLAICPAGPGAPSDFPLTVASMLARTGMLHLGQPIQVADATRVRLADATQFSDEFTRLTDDGHLILMALAPMSENPVTVSLAKSADAALLCVMLEYMPAAAAKATINRVGKSHFLGTAVFRPEMLSAAAKR